MLTRESLHHMPPVRKRVTANKVDLAMFRGSEDLIRCKNCQADMDTMTAYRGERVGSEIVRREDPKG